MTSAKLKRAEWPSAGADVRRSGKIVEGHLSGDPGLGYFAFSPAGGSTRAPLLVAVHGLSDRPDAHIQHLRSLAERFGVVVLAPHFSRPAFRDYQRLGREGRGERADRALLGLVEAVGRSIGAEWKRFFLMGYSGGGQFVHRFVLAYPDRVAAAVASSAGWYTFPDHTRSYPLGIGSARRLPGVSFDPERFLRVPILVTVGERDVRRDRVLRKTTRVDLQQGRTRLERAQRWVDAMVRAAEERGLAPSVSLRTLPDIGHCFSASMSRGRLGALAFTHLFGCARPDPRVTEPEPRRHAEPSEP